MARKHLIYEGDDERRNEIILHALLIYEMTGNVERAFEYIVDNLEGSAIIIEGEQ